MDGGGSRRSRVERGGRLLMGVSCCDPLTSPKSFSIFWPFFFHYFTFTWVILTLKADNTSNQLKRVLYTIQKCIIFNPDDIWQDQRLISILGLIINKERIFAFELFGMLICFFAVVAITFCSQE